MFTMRFDMRAPEGATTTPGLYEAAVGMAEWAEDRGGVTTLISEHHASPDGYLPSPLLLASAMVARTTHMPFTVAAALMPFYDPIRLAEDMAVLDIMSKGRVSYVLALGYRSEEFELFGVDWDRRGAVAERKLAVLLQAVKGEPFEYEGRWVQVTSSPTAPINIWWGGGTKPPRDAPVATGSTSSPRATATGSSRRTSRKRANTATNLGCACWLRRAPPLPCSSPTTSTGHGTRSVRT